jgi:broad specificity phosphatase PhoE
VAAYVVRHAKAGDREAWEGDDRLRPLTKSGRRQAAGLVEVLKGEPIDKVLSSAYLRCRETVEPLAESRHLPVENTPELEEGAGGDSILRLVRRFRGKNVVLCTHGDVVEELLEHLMAQGLVSRAQASNEKGGTWVLEERSGEVSGASYRPAP